VNYVVHFYYKGFVVYGRTPGDAWVFTKLNNTPHYCIFRTSEQKDTGTELADWVWFLELEEGRHLRQLVKLEQA